MSKLPEFVIDRSFDASADLVWKTWSDPELLARWYGPGVDTIIHRFDLKPGGLWLNEMRWGDNSMFSKAEFLEVEREKRLTWHHASTDADWNIAANPMMPDWPRVLLTVVTLTANGAGTDLRLTWTPHDATDAEIRCFEAAMAKFGNGWGAGFDIMADILADLQAE